MNQDDLGSEDGVRASLDRENREELAAAEGISPVSTPWLWCARMGDLLEPQWEMAAHVLNAFRPTSREAWPPSNFVQKLFEALKVGDWPNLDLVAKGFPEYVGFWRELSADHARVDVLERSVAAHYAVPSQRG